MCEEIKDNSVSDTWTEDEKKNIIDCMVSKWNDAKQEVVDFFSGMYSNWNPCFTSTGESTGKFNLPDKQPLIDRFWLAVMECFERDPKSCQSGDHLRLQDKCGMLILRTRFPSRRIGS